MYNRDCMIHHCTNFVRSGSPFAEVIKPVLESFFGEGCVDAPKAYTPINENKIKLAKMCIRDSLNPGSVSIPKEGSAHGYMLWENDTFIWKDLADGAAYRVWRAE